MHPMSGCSTTTVHEHNSQHCSVQKSTCSVFIKIQRLIKTLYCTVSSVNYQSFQTKSMVIQLSFKLFSSKSFQERPCACWKNANVTMICCWENMVMTSKGSCGTVAHLSANVINGIIAISWGIWSFQAFSNSSSAHENWRMAV